MTKCTLQGSHKTGTLIKCTADIPACWLRHGWDGIHGFFRLSPLTQGHVFIIQNEKNKAKPPQHAMVKFI